jgi:probable rRNA maturation factor
MEPGESCPTILFRAVPASARLSAEHKRELKRFAADLSQRVADGRSFTCVITNDRGLRRLNKDFLAHDYPTDVLSFPSAAGALGDVAISSERALAQAAEFGHSLLDEIRILMLHGVLHLTGFDHERDRGEMARAERTWRGYFKLPRTLLGRTAGSVEAIR